MTFRNKENKLLIHKNLDGFKRTTLNGKNQYQRLHAVYDFIYIAFLRNDKYRNGK